MYITMNNSMELVKYIWGRGIGQGRYKRPNSVLFRQIKLYTEGLIAYVVIQQGTERQKSSCKEVIGVIIESDTDLQDIPIKGLYEIEVGIGKIRQIEGLTESSVMDIVTFNREKLYVENYHIRSNSDVSLFAEFVGKEEYYKETPLENWSKNIKYKDSTKTR